MNWYYAIDGRQIGPVNEAALEELVGAGVVRADTLVWREGLANWQPHGVARGIRTTGMPEGAAGTRFCSECGRPFSVAELVPIGQGWVCAACKPVFLQRLREGGQPAAAMRYGGFWIRFAARLIDTAILSIFNFFLALILLAPLILRRSSEPSLAATLLVQLVAILIQGAYECYFVGSRGGTPGKLMLSLRVVRADGSPVSYGLALGRYLATLVSSITLGIGYIIAAFDEQKRTLHDRICETRVVQV